MLTKPLGTGILATALKRDALLEAGIAEAVRSMTHAERRRRPRGAGGRRQRRHRRDRVRAGRPSGSTCSKRAGSAAELVFDTLPILSHARNLAARGFIPGGTKRNLEAADRRHLGTRPLRPTDRWLSVDAQTSGGLLLAVPPENEKALLEALRAQARRGGRSMGRLTAEPGRLQVLQRAPAPVTGRSALPRPMHCAGPPNDWTNSSAPYGTVFGWR